jgi:hypothetical protein
MHGKIGEPIFSDGAGRKYSPITSKNGLIVATDGIRLIGEMGSKNPLYDAAHSLIAKADSIVFLGFGYHSENMERLQTSAYATRNANILCSTLGLLDSEETFFVRKKLSARSVTTNAFDCLTMLRYHLEIFYNT